MDLIRVGTKPPTIYLPGLRRGREGKVAVQTVQWKATPFNGGLKAIVEEDAIRLCLFKFYTEGKVGLFDSGEFELVEFDFRNVEPFFFKGHRICKILLPKIMKQEKNEKLWIDDTLCRIAREWLSSNIPISIEFIADRSKQSITELKIFHTPDPSGSSEGTYEGTLIIPIIND